MKVLEQESTYGMSPEETFESSPIGEYLRRQRVLRGMSAEELAELTRIPLRSLERLESGQFDGETDGFVRGFVRTVAAALGLDTDDAVARMLQEPEPSAWERGGHARTAKQAGAISVFVLLVFGLLLGLRSIWGTVVGDPAEPGARDVVIWRDPVRALAEASHAGSGSSADDLDPGAPLLPGTAAGGPPSLLGSGDASSADADPGAAKVTPAAASSPRAR